jgi:hypothetical protein
MVFMAIFVSPGWNNVPNISLFPWFFLLFQFFTGRKCTERELINFMRNLDPRFPETLHPTTATSSFALPELGDHVGNLITRMKDVILLALLFYCSPSLFFLLGAIYKFINGCRIVGVSLRFGCSISSWGFN